MQDFEKLGVFYLGKETDTDTRKRSDRYLLYDSRDLTTHAVCVGMTGSGKTGLCIDVIEEAAIDGIPAIVIDPKGDMTNLALSFPDLSGPALEPWVNAEEAAKKGQTVAEYAAAQADLWIKGQAEWEQDKSRILRMRENAEIEIYTPGSTAGKPLSLVDLFGVPPESILGDPESLGEHVSGAASSLLGLLGIDSDPLQSREHILISNILMSSWNERKSLDLAALIGLIQRPSFTSIGVMPLDSFYPEKDRTALALSLNNLLASPTFSVWMQGEPLSIDSLLYTPSGKPRISILSIGHLRDTERMFFVSLLLNKTVSWMRSQSGTSSLRAILYMDEIFGFFPPIANPPTKQPLLTLLKQARAFGLGVMLTTQNPGDLDYKGLSNIGTWFVGRLQTERDREKLLDGLVGAGQAGGTSLDRGELGKLLASLENRIFLMQNTHEDGPVLFETRWCLSYLRGPMTRTEIQRLGVPVATPAAPATSPAAPPSPEPSAEPVTGSPATLPPATPSAPPPAPPVVLPVTTVSGTNSSTAAPSGVPGDIRQVFLPYRGSSEGILYRPGLAGVLSVRFSDATSGLSSDKNELRFAPFTDALVPLDWDAGESLTIPAEELSSAGVTGAAFLPVPLQAQKKTSYSDWERDLSDFAYRNTTLDLFRCSLLKKTSSPGESEKDFRIRLAQENREGRDEEVDKLRKVYAAKIATLNERIRKAEQAVDREKKQADDAKMQTAISLGSTVLGALLGRKAISTGSLGKAATTARGISRSVKQSSDVKRSEETVEVYQTQVTELEAELGAEIAKLTAGSDAATNDITPFTLRPQKKDCSVKALVFCWEPVRGKEDGSFEKAW